MVKKLSKKAEKAPVEVEETVVETEEEVITPIPSEETSSSLGNPSTVLLNGVIKKVSEVFGLDDSYVLLTFADKGGSAQIALANPDYKVAVEVKGMALVNLKLDLGLLD